MNRLRHATDYLGFILKESFLSFDRNRGFGKAATLAYYSFFALFPLLLLMLFLLGHFLVSSQAAMGAIDRITHTLFPVFSAAIVREVEALARQRAWGVASLLILFWTVTPLASSIRATLGEIFKEDASLPFLKAKVTDAFAVLAMLLLLVFLVTGEIAYSFAVSRFATRLTLLMRVANLVVPLLMALVFLFFFFLVFAPVRLKARHLLVGCLLTAFLLSVIRPAFTMVLRFDPGYGVTFGSLKAVFLMLVWVYYAFAMLLFGTEVMANMHRKNALIVAGLLAGRPGSHKHAVRLTHAIREFGPDDVVCREGDPGGEMFYVLSGRVALSQKGQPLRSMGKGEYFGEMAMLLSTPRIATATALEADTKLVAIAFSDLETVFRENPKVVLALLKEMADRLKETDARLTSA